MNADRKPDRDRGPQAMPRQSMSELPDYVQRNRAAWDAWAADYVAPAEANWVAAPATCRRGWRGAAPGWWASTTRRPSSRPRGVSNRSTDWSLRCCTAMPNRSHAPTRASISPSPPPAGREEPLSVRHARVGTPMAVRGGVEGSEALLRPSRRFCRPADSTQENDALQRCLATRSCGRSKASGVRRQGRRSRSVSRGRGSPVC